MDPYKPAHHILVVEDSDTQAAQMQILLEAEGCRVTRAASAEGALMALSESLPDLILLDYYLPDFHGDRLCRQVRRNQRTQEVPILLLTSAEGQEHELNALQSGADDYVSKTVPFELLMARLRSLLEKHEARASLAAAYQQQHRVADALQNSLLSEPPLDAFPGLAFRMVYEPAWDEAQVGGDFFDIRAYERYVAFVIGDVAGKGLEAAVFTAEVKFALRAILHEYDDPGRALTLLNNFMVAGAERNPWSSTTLVAVTVALYDRETGSVRFAFAGAEPPLLLTRDGEASGDDRFGGAMLGIMPDQAYATVELPLNPGDTVLLVTDGITEAHRSGGDLFGIDGLMRVASDSVRSDPESLDTLVESIVREARQFAGGRLRDDVCMIAFRRG